MKEVQRRLQRVALLPGTKQQKISINAATVMPVLYGFDTAQFAHETSANGPHLPVDGSDSEGGYSGQHWVEVVAPYSLVVDGTRYDLRDMTTKKQKTLDHLLRQALRNRELRDVRADNRRGRLRKRAEF